MKSLFFSLTLLLCSYVATSQSMPVEYHISATPTQWYKSKVAYLGDSITDKRRVGTRKVFWEYLEEYLGIESSYVFAKSGHTWMDLMQQAQELKDANISDLSAIIIFAGTNDYNSNTEIGTLYYESIQQTNHNGKLVQRKYRESSYDMDSFYGRINSVVAFLKEQFPKQQIVILTPIHRGFAKFGQNNIQPDERYANALGLYIDDYVEAIKKAGVYWSVPIIDLFSTVGLAPLVPAHDIYFANKEEDLLHPNTEGHERMAKTIAYQLLRLPSKF